MKQKTRSYKIPLQSLQQKFIILCTKTVCRYLPVSLNLTKSSAKPTCKLN